MLLIIEALLLISAALGQDHRAAEGQIFPLDMAPDSVDDYYYGCRVKMAKEVKTNYLKKELDNSEFGKAWQESEKKASKKSLKRHNSVAIYMYTNTDFKIYDKFNNDGRNGKKSYAARTYKWYSLQFLLTEAIETLRKKQTGCFKTFRGTNVQFNGRVSTYIRFGSFTSSSLNQYIAQRFGKKSCFEIYTCLGADVSEYSRLPYEKEVLIPPYEMFNITAVRTKQNETDLWCETVFTLSHHGTRSELNCALFKKPTKTIGMYNAEKSVLK
ncbi:erythroblast NAD(P)(+)--arginine ADP-ribosyltransferase-like [Pseudorasbora parva]|uniref:erythroblast NAD(P)(+)--arginine ADP-ribosyltransferase-like n=1 Tax=Pseudorasbora parva TaxID=51549 RepID=UPI00351DF20D